MELVVWEVMTLLVALSFTALGIFAWKRKKPMWFWSGSEVRKEQIADVPAYNRANGIMWLVFSTVFWISTVLGFLNMRTGGICVSSA